MEYAFHLYNKIAVDGMIMATEKLLQSNLQEKLASTKNNPQTAVFRRAFQSKRFNPPVVVCVGSDLAIGDSLGPIVGSMLKYKTQGISAFIYGTLASPVTAKEIKYLRSHLKDTHAGSQIIAIDAAVGGEGDVGLIKLLDSPLYPGAGANKRLGTLGDISILGIVAEKSIANYGLLNSTRLNLVYGMAELISDAISSLLWQKQNAPVNEIIAPPFSV